jgi:hypothetical protein
MISKNFLTKAIQFWEISTMIWYYASTKLYRIFHQVEIWFIFIFIFPIILCLATLKSQLRFTSGAKLNSLLMILKIKFAEIGQKLSIQSLSDILEVELQNGVGIQEAIALTAKNVYDQIYQLVTNVTILVESFSTWCNQILVLVLNSSISKVDWCLQNARKGNNPEQLCEAEKFVNDQVFQFNLPAEKVEEKIAAMKEALNELDQPMSLEDRVDTDKLAWLEKGWRHHQYV